MEGLVFFLCFATPVHHLRACLVSRVDIVIKSRTAVPSAFDGHYTHRLPIVLTLSVFDGHCTNHLSLVLSPSVFDGHCTHRLSLVLTPSADHLHVHTVTTLDVFLRFGGRDMLQ